MTEFSLIIVAAGSGTRLGHDTPKQYLSLGGITILRRSINAFRNMDGLKSVCVVINPAHQELLNNAIVGLENIIVVHGGSTRQESVYNGLKALNTTKNDIVLVHDADRKRT